MSNSALTFLHEDHVIFKESVNFTAGRSGFSAALIEKDYYCTILLNYLQMNGGKQLTFKGGTSISKVYFDFYRLSEDLDFIIPMPLTATQKQRSGRVADLKKAVNTLPKRFPFFSLPEEMRGANGSRQYLATIAYGSLISNQSETIKIEIGLREPLLREAMAAKAKTMLVNVVNSQDAFRPLECMCLSLEEAMSEKFRAALSRREVAIRDFYDIDYAATKRGFEYNSGEFLDLIRSKLAVPGNDPPDTSNGRLTSLRYQLETRLKPVLRDVDFKAFDLERAIDIVRKVHQRLQ